MSRRFLFSLGFLYFRDILTESLSQAKSCHLTNKLTVPCFQCHLAGQRNPEKQTNVVDENDFNLLKIQSKGSCWFAFKCDLKFDPSVLNYKPARSLHIANCNKPSRVDSLELSFNRRTRKRHATNNRKCKLLTLIPCGPTRPWAPRRPFDP